MTTTRRALSSLAVLALAAGLVTGCGDKDDPSPSAGSEATATAPVEASDGGGEGAEPTKPDVPKPDPKDYPGMDEHTDEGAEQAYQYYWDMIFWGYQSGDTEELKTLQTEDCTSCSAIVRDLDKMGRSGTQWSETRVSNCTIDEVESLGEEYAFQYSCVLGEHYEPAAGNTEPSRVEPFTYYASGGVNWVDGRWKVNDAATDTGEAG